MKPIWSAPLLLSLLCTGCFVGALDTDLGPRNKGMGGESASGGKSSGDGGSGGKGSSSGGSKPNISGNTGGKASGGRATGGTDATGGEESGGSESGGRPGNTGGAEANTGGNDSTGGGESAGGSESTGGGSGGSRTELITNGGFEVDTSGWYTWSDTQLRTTARRAHSGERSLLAEGSGTGPAATDLTSRVEVGNSYYVSFWVSVGDSVSTSHVKATVALRCGSNTDYVTIDANDAVPSDGWVELSGTISIDPSCDLTQFQPYVEGDGDDVDLYVDDVSISF